MENGESPADVDLMEERKEKGRGKSKETKHVRWTSRNELDIQTNLYFWNRMRHVIYITEVHSQAPARGSKIHALMLPKTP